MFMWYYVKMTFNYNLPIKKNTKQTQNNNNKKVNPMMMVHDHDE